MKYNSLMRAIGPAAIFPQHTGERIYMRPFHKADGLPADLQRWQPLVDSMLVGVDTDLPIYLMVDQAELKAGQYHRRAGLHVDGYWNPAHNGHGGHGEKPTFVGWQSISAHGASGGRHIPSMPSGGGHGSSSGRHSWNIHPGILEQLRDKKPKPMPGKRKPMKKAEWGSSAFDEKEAIILCSNVAACRAVVGEFEGPIGEGGNCSELNFDNSESFLMDAGTVYAGNVTFVHETVPVLADCHRTVVRLNVPGWHP